MPLCISLKGKSTGKIDIYKTEEAYERALANLDRSEKLSKQDKELMHELIPHMQSRGTGKRRIIKYIYTLIPLAEMAEKPLNTLDRKDAEKLVAKINTSDKRDSTKRDYKIVLKRYIQFAKGYDEDDHEYPDEVKWIRTARAMLLLVDNPVRMNRKETKKV